MFEDKLRGKTLSVYEEWLKTASNEHLVLFKQMVANTKQQNPKLTEAAARQHVMSTLREMGVMT